MPATGTPDSRGFTYAPASAQSKARGKPGVRRAACIKLAYFAGEACADAVIEGMIWAFDNNRDPTGMVREANQTYGLEVFAMSRANGPGHPVTAVAEAFAQGYRNRGRARKGEINEACEAMNERLGLDRRVVSER